jgi:hypothetical protein
MFRKFEVYKTMVVYIFFISFVTESIMTGFQFSIAFYFFKERYEFWSGSVRNIRYETTRCDPNRKWFFHQDWKNKHSQLENANLKSDVSFLLAYYYILSIKYPLPIKFVFVFLKALADLPLSIKSVVVQRFVDNLSINK